MSATLSIRPATTADAAAIEQLLLASRLPLDGVAGMLAQDASQFVVADAGEADLHAMAALEVHGAYALLRSVAVQPAWRGTGLGQRIVERAIEAARARDLHALYLLTTTAAHWFPRFGFAVVERHTIPDAIATSVEFASACPSTAIAMGLALVAET